MAKPIMSTLLAKPQWKWDAGAAAGYLMLGNGAVASTKEIAPNVIIDYDLIGNIVGIEIL